MRNYVTGCGSNILLSSQWPIGRQVRHLEVQGSCKIGGMCPAVCQSMSGLIETVILDIFLPAVAMCANAISNHDIHGSRQ